MIKVLFICHGNICRSPMAEFIMKDIVKKEGYENTIYISSSATSTEEIGNNIYPPAQAELKNRKIPFENHYANQVKKSDYDKYDLFVIMDENNKRNLDRIFRNDHENKIHKLLEFAGRTDDVSDPWYSRRFDIAFDDIYSGCLGLWEYIKKHYEI